MYLLLIGYNFCFISYSDFFFLQGNVEGAIGDCIKWERFYLSSSNFKNWDIGVQVTSSTIDPNVFLFFSSLIFSIFSFIIIITGFVSIKGE